MVRRGFHPSHLLHLAWLLMAAGFAPQPIQAQTTVLEGHVVSTAGERAVEFALVHLEEIRRSATTDINGVFRIANVPAGEHTIHITRIGFGSIDQLIDVAGEDTLRLRFLMTPEVLLHDELVVQGDRIVGSAVSSEQELGGEELREHLGTTIAETLNDLPGLSTRSMGPAPARPVLRGLGGERLLVLENGSRTGDLSQTSTDHALVVDPLAASRIEIIRGPAALVYGSNTLAGAINVVNESILATVPIRAQGTATFQGQSVSSGVAAGFSASAPIGSAFTAHARATAREAGDVNTPDGRLNNTELSTRSGEAGMSWVGSRGYFGFSGSVYDSDYGLPGGFIGAHPNGVSVSVERRMMMYRAEVTQPLNWINRLEVDASWTRYFHQEFESTGALGAEFGVITWRAKATAHTAEVGIFHRGAVGAWVEYRDYATGGFVFTPPTTERTVAAVAYQDIHIGVGVLEAGLRYDSKLVTPQREFTSDIGDIRQQSFGGVSASLMYLYRMSNGVSARLLAMRSLRLPGIEELYSEGPHLAAYSFEVGNPELPAELGNGVELAVMVDRSRVSASAAAFVNQFEGYIFPENTGELNFRIYLPIFQFSGVDARMVGAEGQLSVIVTPRIEWESTASWVRGTMTETDQPIPWTPPLKGRSSLTWNGDILKVSAAVRAASKQTRLGPFEEQTDGYLVPDLSIQSHFVRADMLHTVTLAIDNVTNTSYRDHLARVKSVMPEPGRNIRLLYRVHF